MDSNVTDPDGIKVTVTIKTYLAKLSLLMAESWGQTKDAAPTVGITQLYSRMKLGIKLLMVTLIMVGLQPFTIYNNRFNLYVLSNQWKPSCLCCG